MSGALTIVGLGPGAPDLMTPAAAHALAGATDLVGYGPYLERIPEIGLIKPFTRPIIAWSWTAPVMR